MAIKTVQAIINGVPTTLTLNSSTGKYEATITAPTKSSYNQSGGYYNVTVKATDTAGNSTSKDATDATLGSKLKLVVKEKVDADFTKLDAIAPIHLDSKFALVDENNNYLEIVGKGSIGHDSTTNGVTNSFEFKLKDKDIKSLRLIPIKYIGEENRILDIYDIDKLPITFEMNEYGKVIIEDIQINDSKIIYTYYTEGFVPYESGLVFFDENEKEIGFSCSSSENKNKKTGRITTTINLEGYGNDLGFSL